MTTEPMQAYHVTLKSGHHSKTLLVIALNFGEAQKLAEEAMKSWGFEYWVTEEIKMVAGSGKYGDGVILVQPITTPAP